MTNNNQDLHAAWEFITRPDKNYTYFAVDGSYGDANNILVVDTTDWTEDDWNKVAEAGDNYIAQTARDISAERGGIRPPINDADNHLSWDRNVLSDNGYVLTDAEWDDFSRFMNNSAGRWFDDRDDSTPDVITLDEV